MTTQSLIARKSEPVELTALRSDFETKALATLQPLSHLQTQFEAALIRQRASSQDPALHQAVDQLLSALARAEIPQPPGHPEIEKLWTIRQQQYETLKTQQYQAWIQLANDHRAAIDQLKQTPGPRLTRWENAALNQEIAWLEAEQAWLAQNYAPWQSGDHWREILHNMKWQGRAKKQESNGLTFLTSRPREETQVLLGHPVPPPFEIEMLVTPDQKELTLPMDAARLTFNLSSEPSATQLADFSFRDAKSFKITKAPGKSLKAGVEQKVTVKVHLQGVDIRVNDTPFHSFSADFTNLSFRPAIGASNGSTVVLKSVKFRRPNAIHRPLSTSGPSLAPNSSAAP
ncbi:hypothetical protein FEM03_21130 [Phragmitibacter flavus]|uniref:Uncharacterized protein n=1 Tax=Phragmitibacter flavus TaxID=2576071 RepID=A0A5R8K8S0_9BACT|nr:hypothetical protein [Phragmitibacter flavus]TLD68690.1 hypothetical protein FEM03_21130 [Phragmitibacter flavus]